MFSRRYDRAVAPANPPPGAAPPSRRPGRWPRPHQVAIALVLIIGVSFSAGLCGVARGWERSALDAALARQAQERAELLRSKTLRSMEALHSIAALYGTRGRITRDEFRAFCGGALARQPELFALGWSPRVSHGEREAYETSARREGWPNFEFSQLDGTGRSVRAAPREEYFPVYYIEPGVRNGGALGFDVSSAASRAAALRKAGDAAAPAATPPVKLVQEADGRPGFVVYLPVYRGPRDTVELRRGNLAGFASAVFRIEDLIAPTVRELTAQGYRVRVADDGDQGPAIYSDGGGGGGGGNADARGVATFDLAGARWKLELQPPPAVASQSHGQSRTILLAGVGLTVLLAGYLCLGIRRTEVIERRVVQRTAQLLAQVSERKRAEEAARLAEARYRGIFDNATEGMFQTTPDGHYVMANVALARIYGYASPGELMSDLADIAFQLYVGANRRDQFIQQVQRDGAISEFESQVYRKDGAVIWISENAHAVRGADGAVLYYEGTVIDVTARRRAAETRQRAHEELEGRVRERTRELALYNQALKAEVAVRVKAEAAAAAANRAKTRFLSNMSHEIRTPMNAILGYAQILHRDRSLRDGQRDAMRTILSSGNHLLALIDDILDLSKIEAGHVEVAAAPFDLGRLLDETAAMFRHRCAQKGIRLEVDAPPPPPGAVCGDEGKLRQVLINLLGNAVKFTDAGAVTLRVERRDDDGGVRFEVADTGPGIAADAQAAVFDPFQQAAAGVRRGGTGLGLAISRQYVEVMGGRLALESSPGRGARFSFALRLPRGEAAELPASDDARRGLAGRVRRRGLRALVVDDVPENLAMLAEILTGVGCEVETAADGEAAVELARRRSPDVAFIDMMMPGIDGLETARRMADRLGARPTRLVATTASAFAHEQRRYAAAGFDDVIAKPIRFERVYRCLDDVLGAAAAAGGDDGAGADEAGDDGGEVAAALRALPDGVRANLAAAAEMCSITDLKRCVADVERAGSPAAPLLRRLRACVRAYDLPGVGRLLAGAAAAAGAGA